MGQTRPLFGLFLFFSQRKDKYSTNFTINDKSIDGVLGNRTRGGMMEGADESTMAAPYRLPGLYKPPAHPCPWAWCFGAEF